MTAKDLGLAIRDAGASWYNHNAFRYGASLSFYTVVSLAPLVLITVSILGLVYDRDSAREQFQAQVGEMVGKEGSKAVDMVLKNAPEHQGTGILATVLGIAAFLGGFTGVFFELQSALNILWDIPPDPNRTFLVSMRKMLFSVAVMGVIGFLMLVSLIVSATLSVVDNYFTPSQASLVLLWHVVNFLVSLAVIALLFAIIYKYLPDAHIAWNDVWIGAGITALLFDIGKVAIGEYLGRSGVASSYGAAGSVIVLLLWVYYSALILFFGAELTHIIANRFGSKIVPTAGAAQTNKENRENEQHTAAEQQPQPVERG